MFPNLKWDYRREWKKCGPRGKIHSFLIIILQQGFYAVMNYRMCRWLVQKKIPLLHIFIQKCSETFTGISIPPTAEIGKGLLIEHFGGIVVNSGAKIGEFCTISHGVTVGSKVPGGGSPTIGNNVYLCAGAKVLGEISVGDNSIIGANCVLMKSVPANSVVVGIPGRVVKEIKDLKEYREFYYED